ncbi:MAG: hypothetical protein M1815_003050 [Lichina confinis]|nr:MAG: hypothetical protein M1815_003050 [Lichina confinis]
MGTATSETGYGPQTVKGVASAGSAWETAHADTKVGYLGETVEEASIRKRQEKLANDFPKRPRLSWNTPKDTERQSDKRVRGPDYGEYELLKSHDYNVEEAPRGTWNFANLGPDLIKQAWSYVDPREERAGMSSAGGVARPGRSFTPPIRL